MSSLQVQIQIVGGNYVLTASVTSTGDMPVDIFTYENTEAGPGQYQGVTTLAEYKRYQTYTGTPIPLFGNRFVKTSSASITIPLGRDPLPIKEKLIADVKAFKAQYSADRVSTEIVNL